MFCCAADHATQGDDVKIDFDFDKYTVTLMKKSSRRCLICIYRVQFCQKKRIANLVWDPHSYDILYKNSSFFCLCV